MIFFTPLLDGMSFDAALFLHVRLQKRFATRRSCPIRLLHSREHRLLAVMRLCILRSDQLRLILGGLFACIGFAPPLSAQLVLSGNENKIELTSGAPRVIPGGTGPDSISILDTGQRTKLPGMPSSLRASP